MKQKAPRKWQKPWKTAMFDLLCWPRWPQKVGQGQPLSSYHCAMTQAIIM